MKLDVFSHHIKVSDLDGGRGKDAMLQFCKPLIQYKLTKVRGQWNRQADRTFAAATADRKEFRFHVNQLDDLLLHLRNYGYKDSELVIVKHPYDRSLFPVVDHVVKEMFDPRPRQVPILEYALKEDFPQKIITLQPGGGKTYCAQRIMWALKIRAVFIFKGGYTDRWVGDLEKTFIFGEGELAVVRGAGGMIKLMEMALANKPLPKAIIISSTTWRDYLKDYEKTNGNSKLYPIPPGDFYVKLGIGFRVIDEVHQDFHLNYRLDLYTHTYKSVSLSGTMVSSDEFMNRMYNIPYPVQRRNDGGGYDVYISVKALFYKLSKPKIINHKGATGGYSHNAFENSLRSKKEMFPNYLKMIQWVVEHYYASVREDGQKMLVFCASVDMCTIVKQHLEKIYPTLTVARYCQGDDYQELVDADIGVSTVLSAGTAIDIPNLRVSLLTTAIDSRQSNEQVLCRTRPLKDWPDITPEFLYFCCEDVDRHHVYHANKKTFFKGRVLTHEEIELPFVI